MSDLQQQKTERIAQASSNQRQAADPALSVWVEASAGTGKTKVLSDRVLRLLLHGTMPARILCLTYTKAAAVEMNNRIAERLSKWAVIPDDKLHAEIEKLLGCKLSDTRNADKLLTQARRLFAVLLDTPGGIKIQTIHSFCQEILKRFPLEAKISPYFEIMDDHEAKEALENIKLDILQGATNQTTVEAVSWLTAHVSESSFPKIIKSITENRALIEDCLRRHHSVDNIVNLTAAALDITPQTSPDELRELFWQGFLPEEIKLLVTALETGTATSREKAVTLANATEHKDFAALCKLFLTDKPLLVQKSCRLFPQAEIIAAHQKQRLEDTVDKITATHLLSATHFVLTLSADFLERYRLYKKHCSKMDYSDLILLARQLLETPQISQWILYKLDGGIDHVLIDEAQDTSPDQWAIVKALTNDFFAGLGSKSEKPTVFVVGDRKQSIYSFQGADPHEFENMYDWFNRQDTSFRRVDMEVSFRSTAAILDVVNAVFASYPAGIGVVRPDQKLAHIPSRIGDGGRVEVWPLFKPETDQNPDNIWLPPVERLTAVSPRTKLAQRLAEMIKEKVSRGEILPSQNRPLRYGDFLILVRQRDDFVKDFVRACKNVNVAVAGADRIKLLEQIVIKDLLALACFTLLPSDDLTLACLLKSPLFGLDDQDLFILCHNRKTSSLWQRLNQNPSYAATASRLQDLLFMAAHNRPFEFFTHVLSELDGRRKFIERLGFECEDPLDEFMNLCLEFEREHIPSLQLFVDWIRRNDIEIKRNLEQTDQDAVRIMTAHGSKGLQAPIVILPDTTRIKAPKQELGWISDDNTLFYPLGKDNYEKQITRLKGNETQRSLEESHRLLYVALTRAEDRLYICGWLQGKQPNDNCWYELCRKAIEPIAQKQPDGTLVYEIAQQISPGQPQNKTTAQPDTFIPAWLKTCPPDESPLAKPLTPSHLDESGIAAISPLSNNNNDKLYARGRLIHKLLQFLPEIAAVDRPHLAHEFLQKQAPDLDDGARRQIITEVLSLLNDPRFAPLFSTNSKAEVSLMGKVDDHIISGQIDRLLITDTKAVIVDYKTNRPAARTPDEIPVAYRKQLRAYRKLIEKIYPDKQVETWILWTNTAQIMQIE